MEFKKAPRHNELTLRDLRWKCNPSIFDFHNTAQIEATEEIIGQERALEALKLGVDIKAPGYNIYISGLSGTGKATTVKHILEKLSTAKAALYDYVYVNNFENPDSPLLLTFPAGKAKEFKKDIISFITFLRERIPLHLDSEIYQDKRKQIVERYKILEQELFRVFEQKLKQDNFSLAEIQVGDSVRPEIVPIIGNEAIPIYQFGKLLQEGKITEDAANMIAQKHQAYQDELIQVFKKGMKINVQLQQDIVNLEKGEVAALIEGAIRSLTEKYATEKILAYLKNIRSSILENLQIFKGQQPNAENAPEGFTIDYFREYEVNIIQDNSGASTRPVIIEITPTFNNLFGTIEKMSDGRGGWYADFTKIKSGSLLKANGGFLVLRTLDLFNEQGVWRTLKRALNYRKLEIQDNPFAFSWNQSVLKPEPIDIDTKVILLGNNNTYHLLAEYEDDFKKIFKVKADFHSEIKRTGDIMLKYARVIKRLVEQEKLLDFHKSAIAYLLELAARYAGKKEKLTTRFSFLADIAREANYWAMDAKSKIVTSDHVRAAYQKAKDRHALAEEKMDEYINENTILIETAGERVGCINGLAVFGTDYYMFGKPVRISSSVALGNGTIINVERESGLSGKIHDKAIHIIGGYFRETFGRQFPLTFSANIVFEQSYGPIDGDSASAAEVFALLSALISVPLKQSLAITGSISQKGEIQPIGGVNEKIEGFYRTCKLKGFVKGQGVIIPEQNVQDLMLNDEVLESVRKKEFHIYPIKRVEEGLELMTGKKAGAIQADETFEKNTLYYCVEAKLKEMYHKAKNPFKEPKMKKARGSKTKETKA